MKKIIQGDENVFDVSIDKNSITRIAYKARIAYKDGPDLLYRNGLYGDGIYNVMINIDAKFTYTGLWNLSSYNLLIHLDSEHTKDDEDKDKTKYYDVTTVEFSTTFLNNNREYNLHDVVWYENINRSNEQNNIKLVIIEIHKSDNQRTRNVFYELSSYLWATGKYDIIFMTIRETIAFNPIEINEYGKALVTLFHNDANTKEIYDKHIIYFIFYDEIYFIVSKKPPYGPLYNTIMFTPNDTPTNPSDITKIHEYLTSWDMFTNNSNYKSQQTTGYVRIIVVDNTDELQQFAECMLKNATGDRKRVILLTDGTDNPGDKITIHRNKNRVSFLI